MTLKVYTGKNLDELLKSVAEEKGVSVDDLTYTVKEEKSGFLGIGGKVEAEVYCSKDIEEFMKNYLDQFFENIEMQADVVVINDNGFYRINIDAENNAVLIGKNGRALQSLNTIVKAAVSAEFRKKIGVLIDINGYKQDKYKKVCALAMRVAKDVRRTKTDAILDPMPADERKAIHNHLADMENISTVSEGEGNQRRLKILYTPDKE
ncbi:Jag family protein [Merdibacter massiliensis]|uniref:Jag family protein n=1 Tax=Merdibacter massiliensis TaxID=1871030 RepID=UPI00096A5D1D|nr:R3H domain-containing nucleic acid-binding protein [Merdibacter massiliensis]